ncbi:hypothetical protein DFH08DRAFT_854380 [Mycena albidolilacea]|uniref:Thioesterase domain-containing protein n=1 Tax=Mycena albidolilacea TaxID=1033008 RepID=A0AAD7EVF0_9AGAR|nr:hypothetical protein DFH08DRAFT_854380 [Mycena albidolilacea]
MAPDRYNATIAEILRAPLPDTILSRIQGNAPPKVKESAVKWLNIFHTFVGALTRKITVTEVSLDPDPLENGRILTLICEIDVTPEMVDGHDNVHNAFVVTVIDECVSSAVTALDYAEGGPGMSGVSLSLDTVFHNPAERGAKLRFVNTTLTAVSGMMSCRCQVWDLTRRRLVATSTFIGMRSSLPKLAGRL